MILSTLGSGMINWRRLSDLIWKTLEARVVTKLYDNIQPLRRDRKQPGRGELEAQRLMATFVTFEPRHLEQRLGIKK